MAKENKKHTGNKFVKFCPRCKSINISLDKSNPLFGAAGLPANYICKDCGYNRRVFPEINISKLKELKESRTEKQTEDLTTNQVDTSYGNFVVKKWWKFAGPFIIILGIIFLYISLNPMECGYEPKETPGPYGLVMVEQVRVCEENADSSLVYLIVSIIAFILGLFSTYVAYFKK